MNWVAVVSCDCTRFVSPMLLGVRMGLGAGTCMRTQRWFTISDVVPHDTILHSSHARAGAFIGLVLIIFLVGVACKEGYIFGYTHRYCTVVELTPWSRACSVFVRPGRRWSADMSKHIICSYGNVQRILSTGAEDLDCYLWI